MRPRGDEIVDEAGQVAGAQVSEARAGSAPGVRRRSGSRARSRTCRRLLRRTSASWTAGRVSRSARSANAIASSLLRRCATRIAVVPTNLRRAVDVDRRDLRARCPNCAAVFGSVVTSALAAWSRVVIANLITRFGARPRAALRTATGKAPASSRTPASLAVECSASGDGTLARTASRVMSVPEGELSRRARRARFASSSSPHRARVGLTQAARACAPAHRR